MIIIYSRNSPVCSFNMRWYSVWNWNHPEYLEPTTAWAAAADSDEISFGAVPVRAPRTDDVDDEDDV